jgi:hypothetical protein
LCENLKWKSALSVSGSSSTKSSAERLEKQKERLSKVQNKLVGNYLLNTMELRLILEIPEAAWEIHDDVIHASFHESQGSCEVPPALIGIFEDILTAGGLEEMKALLQRISKHEFEEGRAQLREVTPWEEID